MKFSRHARNRMRQLRLTRDDVVAIIESPLADDVDGKGNRRFTGRVGGLIIRVVVAADDPEFVVSVHERRRL